MKKILLLAAILSVFSEARAQADFHKPTYVNYTEFGGLFGRVAFGTPTAQTVENRLSFTMQTFNGVQLNHRLAVGGLVGIDWYKAALVMPVGAGLRYDLIRVTDKHVRLLAITDVGYGLTFLHKSSTGYEINGGWMFNPGVALRIGKPASNAFIMSLTYKKQALDVQKPLFANDIQRDEHRIYNRMCFRVGIAF